MPKEVAATLNDEKLCKDVFNRVLLDAIDEGFLSLGNLPREAMFHNLEASFEIKKEDVPLNLTKFKTFLETIFGPGTPYLESIIAKRLCEKLGIDSGKLESTDLIVCVAELKRHLLSDGEKI
jgi:hypothetical protein